MSLTNGHTEATVGGIEHTDIAIIRRVLGSILFQIEIILLWNIEESEAVLLPSRRITHERTDNT